MPRTPKDRHDVNIEVGQLVAYNYSGQIALGVVDRIVPSAIYILRCDKGGRLDVNTWTKNPRSKVRYGTSLLVIQQPHGNIVIPTLKHNVSVRPGL